MSRSALGVAAIATALATITTVATAAAAGARHPATASATRCKVLWDDRVVPGFGLKATRGKIFIEPGGTISCDGPVLGKQVTGPGTVGGGGRYGTAHPDSCTTGAEGDGTFDYTFPTSQGPLRVHDPATYTLKPISEAGLLTGNLNGKYLSGTFTVKPTKGDCVTSAITAAQVTLTGSLHGS